MKKLIYTFAFLSVTSFGFSQHFEYDDADSYFTVESDKVLNANDYLKDGITPLGDVTKFALVCRTKEGVIFLKGDKKWQGEGLSAEDDGIKLALNETAVFQRGPDDIWQAYASTPYKKPQPIEEKVVEKAAPIGKIENFLVKQTITGKGYLKYGESQQSLRQKGVFVKGGTYLMQIKGKSNVGVQVGNGETVIISSKLSENDYAKKTFVAKSDVLTFSAPKGKKVYVGRLQIKRIK